MLIYNTTQVVITSTAGANKSVENRRQLNFRADEASHTLTFSDGKQLRVAQFDEAKIIAYYDAIQFDFNRGDGMLTYAGANTVGSTTTTIIGSGHCQSAPNAH